MPTPSGLHCHVTLSIGGVTIGVEYAEVYVWPFEVLITILYLRFSGKSSGSETYWPDFNSAKRNSLPNSLSIDTCAPASTSAPALSLTEVVLLREIVVTAFCPTFI